MEMSVIYSIDTPREVSIAPFNPPKSQRRLWQLTEDDSGYEYSYLEGRWEKGKHRKWVALLTREQFDEFLDHTGLFAEDVATMGSIGAPGCGYGLAPAFAFRTDEQDAIQNAYVTPLASGSEMVEFLASVNDEHGYYSTLGHESIHWCQPRLGHKESYAFEELVAELGGTFLAAELGVPNSQDLTNCEAYIASWVRELENDHGAIFRASKQASLSASYILAFSRKAESEEQEEAGELAAV